MQVTKQTLRGWENKLRWKLRPEVPSSLGGDILFQNHFYKLLELGDEEKQGSYQS